MLTTVAERFLCEKCALLKTNIYSGHHGVVGDSFVWVDVFLTLLMTYLISSAEKNISIIK